VDYSGIQAEVHKAGLKRLKSLIHICDVESNNTQAELWNIALKQYLPGRD
jgi:hypothetical protein